MNTISKISKLTNNQGLLKYINNTSWLLAERILRVVISLFVGIWVARYLGPDQFGLFNYALSFVGIFAAIATLGLDSIVVRELVKDGHKRDILLGTVFLLQFIGSIAMLIILAVVVSLTSNDQYANTLVYIIASSAILQGFNVIDHYFQSKVLSKYIVYASLLSLLISSIIKIVLVLTEASLMAFAYVVVFDRVVLVAGFLLFYSYKHLSFMSWRFKKDVAVSLLKDSWPLIMSGIVVSIYMRIDQIMIKEMLDSGAVGQYTAAVRLSEALYFIPAIITSSFFPAIVNAKKHSDDLYYSRLQYLYSFLVMLGIIVALPMLFLSDWIVNILYGEQYSQAGSVLIIHIWAGVFVFLGAGQARFWLAQNMQKQVFMITFSMSIINIVLNVILINSYGVRGAAISTLITLALGCLVFPYLIKDARKMLAISYKSFFCKGLIK